MATRLSTATRRALLVCIACLMAAGPSAAAAAVQTAPAGAVASVTPVGNVSCQAGGTCENYDAIVFVHGIYGGDDTFVNASTHFDWAQQFPRRIRERWADVFHLTYKTELFIWARGSNPDFSDVAGAIFTAMAPLRKRQYRSIGFIAHSLGGNFVSTYLHMVKTRFGHPQRSQHAYVITLATPVLGAQIADLALPLKQLIFMSDPLLESLKKGNLYLEMLNHFTTLAAPKGDAYGCRPVGLHAAYEEQYLGPLLDVRRDSAAAAISQMVTSPVIGFPRDHSEIAKPSGTSDDVYRWVDQRVGDEFLRLALWDRAHAASPADFRLCDDMRFKKES